MPGAGRRATSSTETAGAAGRSATGVVEEGDGGGPGPARRLGAVHLGPGVIEEGVVDAGVDGQLDVLAQALELRLQRPHPVGAEEAVLLGVVAADFGGQGR